MCPQRGTSGLRRGLSPPGRTFKERKKEKKKKEKRKGKEKAGNVPVATYQVVASRAP